MKSFRTELSVAPGPFTIKLSDSILTLGSCFSDSIGAVLTQNKFTALVNPMGTVYNPLSIHKMLLYAAGLPVENKWCYQQQRWSHFDFHSSSSHSDKSKATEAIDSAIAATQNILSAGPVIIITYGTAWVYRLLSTNELVANCHKQPAQNFSKTLLGVEEITASFKDVYYTLKNINQTTRFILTLSPVRHLKESLEGNSLSKSILRVAIGKIIHDHPDIDYFPASEIMLDDLRDYRFFEADMIHPSNEAVNYIWEKFNERYFSSSLREILTKWNALVPALHHKPFHPGSDEHQKFLRSTLKRLEELKPDLNVEEEITALQASIIN